MKTLRKNIFFTSFLNNNNNNQRIWYKLVNFKLGLCVFLVSYCAQNFSNQVQRPGHQNWCWFISIHLLQVHENVRNTWEGLWFILWWKVWPAARIFVRSIWLSKCIHIVCGWEKRRKFNLFIFPFLKCLLLIWVISHDLPFVFVAIDEIFGVNKASSNSTCSWIISSISCVFRSPVMLNSNTFLPELEVKC